MLVLGHIGIALGAATICIRISNSCCVHGFKQTDTAKPFNHRDDKLHASQNWFVLLGRRIDIRLVLIGSLLPDIIDKPVGAFFFKDIFSYGRIFSHTLVFLLLISIVGYVLYRRVGKSWLIALSFGTFMHLICDNMWVTPEIVLWPAYGWAFSYYEQIHTGNWFENIFSNLRTYPVIYVPEIVGAVILALFIWMLIKRHRVYAFIRYGRIW